MTGFQYDMHLDTSIRSDNTKKASYRPACQCNNSKADFFAAVLIPETSPQVQISSGFRHARTGKKVVCGYILNYIEDAETISLQPADQTDAKLRIKY